MSRNTYVEYQERQVIGKTAGTAATWRERAKSRRLMQGLQKERQRWTFKPSDMKVVLNRSAGPFQAGLVLTVSHELGRYLLWRKVAAIVERDFPADASVTGTFEDTLELLGLSASESFIWRARHN